MPYLRARNRGAVAATPRRQETSNDPQRRASRDDEAATCGIGGRWRAMIRKAVPLAALVLGIFAVAGCGSPVPVVEPDPPPAIPPPAVLPVQTERILTDLGEGLTRSQAEGTATVSARIGGVALEMRTAEFAMHAQAPEDVNPEVLGTDFTGTIVPATDRWPRHFIAVTSPGEGGAQYLYLLTQADPRAPYAMTSWVRLLAGVTLPETAPADVGSPVLDPTAPGDLAVAPDAALATYAAAKDDPTAPAAESFTGTDPARDAWSVLVDRWGSALAPINGTVTPASSVDAGSVYTIATADGGAIVIGTIRSTLTLRIPGGNEGQSFTLASYLGALGANGTTVTQAASIGFAQPIALAIPSGAAGGTMTVLGVSQVPVAVSTE
jgi:hypothetical protein